MNTCKQAPGEFIPKINRERCEGKGPCVPVCPYQVLEVRTLPPDQRAGLSLKGKLKGFVHRWQQAIVVQADLCQACGLCVTACPEKAITLIRRPAGS
ncbi:4Fe-4S dicluster domain-containing protein [Undibacterium squillarum]|uniref:4Fe-4S ferredoxin-type domain-containing protein n=1 Tax=Undibacterium squillarum TaxID=1131567 RepID=A0ABQ2Y379_9BURK|nr:4Fe-4S binding protein [Undibacterium squillarum]GGX53257.1 hypothetical protein GCM10010946_34810 [Undibacterium squillarum]